MMLNKMPVNTSIPAILTYLETATKWGARNRALYALRQRLRIKDISDLRVSDLVNPDSTICWFFIAKDGTRFELSDQLQTEVKRYLIARFDITGHSLEPLLGVDLNIALFPTQKSRQFSPNTLAQHFSYLDKVIQQRFQASGQDQRNVSKLASSALTTPVNISTKTRLLNALTYARKITW